MIELPQRHLRADVLAHGDERDADHRERLERVVLLGRPLFCLVDMVVAVVQHRLYLQHVARARERADLHEDLRGLRDAVLHDLQRLQCRV